MGCELIHNSMPNVAHTPSTFKLRMEEVKETQGGPVLQEKKPISARRKWLKRILIGTFSLVVLLFSGLVLAVTVYEDEIVTYALQSVKEI